MNIPVDIMNEQIKKLIDRYELKEHYERLATAARVVDRNVLILFIPALGFVMLGVAALVAPRFLALMLAAFFVGIGLFLAFVAWRAILLKRKVEKLVRDFGARVTIHAVNVPTRFESEESNEGKKIIFH